MNKENYCILDRNNNIVDEYSDYWKQIDAIDYFNEDLNGDVRGEMREREDERRLIVSEYEEALISDKSRYV